MNMLRINMKIMVDGKEFIEKERYTWKMVQTIGEKFC